MIRPWISIVHVCGTAGAFMDAAHHIMDSTRVMRCMLHVIVHTVMNAIYLWVHHILWYDVALLR